MTRNKFAIGQTVDFARSAPIDIDIHVVLGEAGERCANADEADSLTMAAS